MNRSPRSHDSRWPDRLYDNYGKNLKLILCPNDTYEPNQTPYPYPMSLGFFGSNNVADASCRSFFINGWNEFFADKFGIKMDGSPNAWADLQDAMVTNNIGMKETDITHPSDTVILGEKQFDHGDFYMDLAEMGGNDWTGILEQSRHDSKGPASSSGGSNFTFADGSARFMKYGASLWPLDLWCVADANRTAMAYKSPGLP